MATLTKWRRTARVAAAVVALACGTATTLAQNNNRNKNQPVPADAPLADRILQKGKTKQWVMLVDVYYPGLRLEYPPLERWGVVRPGFANPSTRFTRADWDRMVADANRGVKFDTAAIVFPVPMNSAAHYFQSGTFKSEVTIDGQTNEMEPKFTDGYQSGERLARWDLRNVDARRLTLHVEVPVTCWETIFNEAEAMKVTWPKGDWPAAAKTALEPVYLVDWRDTEQEIADNKAAVDKLVQGWLNGRDPKSVPPVMLAKELAGRVMEFCNPGDGTSIYGSMSGTFFGLLTRTTGEIITSKRCLTLDPPVLLSAVYRSVGLPSRLVYGFDMSEERGERGGTGNAKISAWTEFAVMDPKDNSAVWIPVDVIGLRRSGSRMQRLDRNWKYFGGDEDLAYQIPISFHVHPPTGVVVRSLPAFWGWLCTPETPPYAHSLKIDAMSQNSREKQKNEEEAKRAKQKGKP